MNGLSDTHAALIESFFGLAPGAARQPEGILGLAPGERRSGVVYAALQARFSELAAHPRAASAEAQLVRLCLQAAATQLLAPAQTPTPPARPVAPSVTPPAKLVATTVPMPPVPSAADRPEEPITPRKVVVPASAKSAPIELEPEPELPEPPASVEPPLVNLVAPPSATSREHASPAPSPRAAASPAPTRLAPVPADPLLAEAANLIATHGGVTPEVVRQIAMLAMAKGLPATAVQSVLTRLTTQNAERADTEPPPPPRAAVASPSPARSSPQATSAAPRTAALPGQSPRPANGTLFQPDPEEEDPGTRLLKTAMLVAGGILIASVGLIIGGAVMLSSVPPAPKAAQLPVPPAPVREAEPPKPPPDDLADIPDAAAVARLVRKVAETARVDRADAVKRLERAAPAFAAWWPRMDIGQRAASMGDLVDASLRIGADPVLSDQLVAILSAGAAPLSGSKPLSADQVLSSVWSVGVLARLSSEQNLPAVVRLRIQNAASAALAGSRLPAAASFQVGAALALRAMPLHIVGDKATAPPADAVAAIQRWLLAVRQLYGSTPPEQAAAEAAIVEGLERLMVGGPEPDENRTIYETMSAIAGALRWRQGDLSRARLISWFDDKRVSPADLAAITAAIVTKSGAEGVDSTMALPPSATGEQRLQLRDAYAAAWNLLSRNAAGMTETWTQVSREELTQPQDTDPLHALQGAVVFARLNEAAWRRHRGDAQGAADVLIHQVAPIRKSTQPTPGTYSTVRPNGGGGPDGTWAVRYLSVDKTLPPKLERLKEIEAKLPTIGPIDADTLAEVAMLGGGELRTSALRLVAGFGTSPPMVESVLKFLPRAVRSPALGKAMVDLSGRALGPWNGERWPAEARKALVERLLELYSAEGATAGIDHAAAQLADSYEAMVREPSEAGVSDDEGGKRAADAAGVLYSALLDQAVRTLPHENAPIPLDEIQQRHESRTAVARGLVQKFAADQLGCLDLLALLASSERPTRAAEVKTILSDAYAKHREAEDVRFQILIAESAMLRLWFVRIGETPP